MMVIPEAATRRASTEFGASACSSVDVGSADSAAVYDGGELLTGVDPLLEVVVASFDGFATLVLS